MGSDWTKHVTLSAGIIVSGLGLAALIGWHFHIIALIQISPDFVPMHRMTAVGFLLSGIALVFAGTNHPRATGICALVVLVEAALVCLEYILNASFGIDQFVGPDYINVHTSHLGRMSPPTAICFLATSIALLAISSRVLPRYAAAVSGILASTLIAVGTVNTLAYLLGHTSTYSWRHLTEMAMHTSGGFIIIGVGLLAPALQHDRAGKRMPAWLPAGLGISLAAGVLGVWQAVITHEESDLPLLSGIILAGGIFGSLLVTIALDRALQARRQSLALQEEKEVLEKVFEAPPDILLLTDRQGRIRRVNRQAQTILGYSQEELVGASIETLVPYRFRERHRVDRVNYIASPLPRSMEKGLDLRALRKDGSEIPVEVSLGAVQSGGEQQVLAVVRDITERKQVEEALRLSEERFRGIFEQGPIGVTLIGADYRIIRANQTFCRMLGYSEEELTRMTPIDITHPEDLDRTAKILGNLFVGEATVSKIEKKYVKKNRETMWGSLSVSVVRDRDGRPLYGLGMLEDISERKHAEEQLRNLTERLSLATRTASIGIWDLDLRTRRAVWDDTSFEIFGMQKSSFVAYEDFSRGVHPEDLPAVEASLQRAIQGKTQDFVEFRVIRPEGSVRHVSSAEGAVLDEQGNVVRLVGTAVDITDRKEMEAQMEASRERMAVSARLSALGMMAGGVAHEINNPLAIIHASASDLLRRIKDEGMAPPAITARNSERILETANRITRIIKSLRHLAREGSHDRMRPASVSRIVEETLEICEERFRHHSVRLILPHIDSALSVVCREVQIAQVLLNLLQNAFDAVIEQLADKWIRLEVKEEDGSVLFAVTDSGPGVLPELKTKIMEPFFTTKDVGKGTGLGLSLSRNIVEDHGGKLELTEQEGRPCFSFRLPLTQKQEVVCS